MPAAETQASVPVEEIAGASLINVTARSVLL